MYDELVEVYEWLAVEASDASGPMVSRTRARPAGRAVGLTPESSTFAAGVDRYLVTAQASHGSRRDAVTARAAASPASGG